VIERATAPGRPDKGGARCGLNRTLPPSVPDGNRHEARHVRTSASGRSSALRAAGLADSRRVGRAVVHTANALGPRPGRLEQTVNTTPSTGPGHGRGSSGDAAGQSALDELVAATMLGRAAA
jgi:hypothetical protein